MKDLKQIALGILAGYAFYLACVFFLRAGDQPMLMAKAGVVLSGVVCLAAMIGLVYATIRLNRPQLRPVHRQRTGFERFCS